MANTKANNKKNMEYKNKERRHYKIKAEDSQIINSFRIKKSRNGAKLIRKEVVKTEHWARKRKKIKMLCFILL